MITPLTKKQKIMLDWINEYIDENDVSPTLDEIRLKFGFKSIGTVQDYVKALEDKGYLRRNKNLARSIQMIDFDSDNMISLPMFGFIAAGAPIEVCEQQETMEVPSTLVGRRPCYILQVKGNSMIEDHILDGDFIVVERCETADDGEVVVALINKNAATLKRLYREKNRVRLEPANSTMKPIYVRDVAVQGKVRGLFRRF